MRLIKLILASIILSFFISCSSVKNNSDARRDVNESIEIRTLEDHLLSKPGVFVQSGQIRIRGGDQSFFADSEPLFIINGQQLSGGYQAAVNFVNAAEIRSVSVLKEATDLAMYGARGLNGVIKIKLKNTSDSR